MAALSYIFRRAGAISRRYALRGVALVVGLAILGATAHVTIAHTGGYGSAAAVLVLAVAGGVGIAALVIGAASAAGRRALARFLVVTIIAGEAFGFLSTAERIVASRDAAQAPLIEAAHVIDNAKARVTAAEAALRDVPTTSPRLTKAEASKAAADKARIDNSTARTCLDNCTKLLEGNAASAGIEVKAARDEVAALKAAAEAELKAARTALLHLKAPPSATPLADRIKVPAWLLDIIAAALGSMAANGLACGLIAYSAHRGPTKGAPKPEPKAQPKPKRPRKDKAKQAPKPAPVPAKRASRPSLKLVTAPATKPAAANQN